MIGQCPNHVVKNVKLPMNRQKGYMIAGSVRRGCKKQRRRIKRQPDHPFRLPIVIDVEAQRLRYRKAKLLKLNGRLFQ